MKFYICLPIVIQNASNGVLEDLPGSKEKGPAVAGP
jgi:hypothetical protein